MVGGQLEFCHDISATPFSWLIELIVEGLDYDSGPPSVVFDGTDNMECFNTSITDDGFLEQDTQNFSILLSSLDPRVSVAPATIEVVIIDTDGEYSQRS